jgi:hypothetical protein
MKQLLLAACAVLALSGSGHARSANIPSFLVDGWCREDQVKLPQAEYNLLSTYYRVSPEIKCDDKMEIKRDGVIFNKEDWCSFVKVEQRTVRNWKVWVRCRSAGTNKWEPAVLFFEGWAGNQVISLWEKE